MTSFWPKPSKAVPESKQRKLFDFSPSKTSSGSLVLLIETLDKRITDDEILLCSRACPFLDEIQSIQNNEQEKASSES